MPDAAEFDKALIDLAHENGVSYAVAWRLAVLGRIRAVRRGGRWYVTSRASEELQAALAATAPTAS